MANAEFGDFSGRDLTGRDSAGDARGASLRERIRAAARGRRPAPLKADTPAHAAHEARLAEEAARQRAEALWREEQAWRQARAAEAARGLRSAPPLHAPARGLGAAPRGAQGAGLRAEPRFSQAPHEAPAFAPPQYDPRLDARHELAPPGFAPEMAAQPSQWQAEAAWPDAAPAHPGAHPGAADEGWPIPGALDAPRVRKHSARAIRGIGALASVAIIGALGYWGYDQALRNARGVPVIQAPEGAMRLAPTEPGGAVMNHQGLSVNHVAAKHNGTGGEHLMLAPMPIELTEEDAPGLSAMLEPLAPSETTLTITPDARPAPPSAATDTPPGLSANMFDGEITEVAAIAADLAEAEADLAADVAPAVQPDAAPVAPITSSLRPRPRPDNLRGVALSAATAPTGQGLGLQLDASTLPVGTRLVQFGAFDTAEDANAEWNRITGRLGPLMNGKAMVLVSAESGGRNFWRLRAYGYENEDDSRRFCAAADAEGVRCIPVVHK